MKTASSLLQELVLGIPFTSSATQVEKSSKRYLPDALGQYHASTTPFKQRKGGSVLATVNKIANGVREHVRLGPKITETVKGKLSLGARILQVGGVEKVFKRLFNVRDGEKLLNASQCYLSTTSGPIAGLLFVSTNKVAFCSERSIKVSSQNGKLLRIHYKVMIPLNKIRSVHQSENMKKPSQKYMEIVTVDNFDFWFMGFLNYQKALRYVQRAACQAQENERHPN